LTGYEIASGAWQQKLDPERVNDFNRRFESNLGLRPGRRRKDEAQSAHRASPEGQRQAKESQSDRVLWIIPGACGILIVLAVLGLPRVPTLTASLMASAYLAYFGVSTEQQLTDPRNTAGIFEHSWLAGYWASWLGLIAPAILAFIRPKRQV